DVNIDLHFAATKAGGTRGFDVDVTHVGVKQQVVSQHVVHADLASQAPGVIQIEAAEAFAFGCAGQLGVEEPGVVQTQADIGLESRARIQRVVHGTQGRRQVLDVRQFAIQAGKRSRHALDAYAVAERRGGQQFDTDFVSD